MDGKFALVNGLNGSVGEIAEDREMLLAGFGSMRADGGGGRARMLMEVAVKSVSKQTCIDANPYSHSRSYINFDHVVCTGGEPGKDSCNGDSGGPAIVMQGGQPWLVGVLSKGSQKPGEPQCMLVGFVGVGVQTCFLVWAVSGRGLQSQLSCYVHPYTDFPHRHITTLPC